MHRLARIGLAGAGIALALSAVARPPASAQTRTEFVATLEYTARLRQRLEHLQRLETQKLWRDWVVQYQALVDEYPDGVVPRDEEFYVGLRYSLASRLEALPAAVKQLYRQQFQGEARRLFDEAARSGDEAKMRQVYGRFRHTAVGPMALEWLAERALDRGNPELARLAYARALQGQPATPLALLKYGLAAAAAGRPQEAAAAFRRAESEFGNQIVRIGGQPVMVAAAARTLAKMAPPPRPGGWRRFQGVDGRRQMTGDLRAPLTRRWEYRFASENNPLSGQRQALIFSGSMGGRWGLSFVSHPLLIDDERVVVQGLRGAAALRLRDGTVEWEVDEIDVQTPERPAFDWDRARIRIYRSGLRSYQVAPVENGGMIFLRVPLNPGDPIRDVSRGNMNFGLAALDARSGRLIWEHVEGANGAGDLWNNPTVLDNVVYTGAVKGQSLCEFRAMALEAGTGEPIWTTYLGGGTDPPLVCDGSPPTVHEGTLWIETPLHTLTGLDLLTGEIRYLYRYQPRARNLAAGGWGESGSVLSNEPISLIAPAGKYLLFASRWGEQVIAFEPRTATLAWTAPKTPAPTLFAAEEDRVYLCGNDVRVHELETGARLWSWSPPQRGGSVGLAALADGKVYVPSDGKIYVLDARNDGRLLATFDLTADLSEAPGYVAVYVMGNRLLVTARQKVICYEGAG